MVYRPFLDLSCALSQHLAGRGTLTSSPISVLDIGAAQGFDPKLERLEPHLLRIGFEPDRREWESLSNAYASEIEAGTVKLHNQALWSHAGELTLYQTGDPDCASFLPPNEEVIATLPDQTPMTVTGEIKLDVATLDGFETGAADVDLIKVDVQGGELEVLKGGERILREQATAVILEVNFTELYSGQASFSELNNYLAGMGFTLVDLDMRRWRRTELPEAFSGYRMGQIAYADALYMKDATHPADGAFAKPLTQEKLLKLLCLYEFFALLDWALEAAEKAISNGLLGQEEGEEVLSALRSNQVLEFYNRNIKPQG